MKGLYNKGLFLTLIGGAGLAENITSGRGCFILCVSLFAVGFSCILVSYFHE